MLLAASSTKDTMSGTFSPLTLKRIPTLGLGLPDCEIPPLAYPGCLCPILICKNGKIQWQQAQLGLIPAWAKLKPTDQATHNARAETIDQRPTYKHAWFNRQLALVPTDGFYDPSFKTGKAIRHRIHHKSDKPFLLAALWDSWLDPTTQQVLYSFSLITINADQHPLMSQMHKPEDEKRTVIVMPFSQKEQWFNASPEQAKAMLYQHQGVPAELFTATAAPLGGLSPQAQLFDND